MVVDFKTFARDCQSRIERALASHLPSATTLPGKLHEAMRYSSLNGGKRIRPMLVYATGQAVHADTRLLDGPACAIEFVHVYSLIHDDLPAMDDDDLRRGQPSCHRAYDEATAILAGDALQALAFEIVANEEGLCADSRIKILQVLARASGSSGMAGGQAIDLQSEGKRLSLDELETMHARKTGALFRAAIQMGALCGTTVSDHDMQALDSFGRCIGLAFQIRDDILDETAETEKLGKTRGSDRKKNKSTFVQLCGLEASRQRARDLLDEAVGMLDSLGGNTRQLRNLARYVVMREY